MFIPPDEDGVVEIEDDAWFLDRSLFSKRSPRRQAR